MKYETPSGNGGLEFWSAGEAELYASITPLCQFPSAI
jgi:hypothetical protein